MKCIRCNRELTLVDGLPICFTKWQDCGIMMEGYYNSEGIFIKNIEHQTFNLGGSK